MKTYNWILFFVLFLYTLITLIVFSNFNKGLKEFKKSQSKEISKLTSLMEDIKEKNNNTCVKKYYEIEQTLNIIKGKLK